MNDIENLTETPKDVVYVADPCTSHSLRVLDRLLVSLIKRYYSVIVL